MRAFAIALLLIAACEGPPGPPGPVGATGDGGANGQPGSTGDAGAPGSNGLSPWLAGDGLAIAIDRIDVAGGAIDFTLTDGAGVALDRTGALTAGTVEVGVVVAQLGVAADGSPGQYTAYTVDAAGVPAAETTGATAALDVAHGHYRYTLAATLAGIDATRTQTVAIAATRANGARADAASSIRLDGATPAVRERVTDASCGSCHGTVRAHAGAWTQTRECTLCHTPQAGAALDLDVVVHGIHQATTYPQQLAKCTACHAGAQGDTFAAAPSKPACTSCHATIAFEQPVPAGMVLHGGGPQPPSAPCNVCHPRTGSVAGIVDKHFTGLLAATAPTVELALVAVANTAPGQAPVATFTARVDGAPADLVGAPLAALVATVAGPTTDYARTWQAKIQGAGASGTLAVVDAATGTYAYTFPAGAAIPADATGSYALALEGYVQPVASGPRYAADNPVLAFAVTDAAPVARRHVVERDRCNHCHADLSAHGGARKNPDYCAFCHNPSAYDSAGAPRFAGTTNVLAEALDLKRFVHRIHRGAALAQPFVVGGFPLPTVANPGGTQVDFGDIAYPRSLGTCTACHATAASTLLPFTGSPATSALLSCTETGAPTAYCDAPYWAVASTTALPPATAACTGCHDAPSTLAHAQTNTAPGGAEACATCHGPGKVEDAARHHAAASP